MQGDNSVKVPQVPKGQRFAISCSHDSNDDVLSICLKSLLHTEQTQSPVDRTTIFLFLLHRKATKGLINLVTDLIAELNDMRLVGGGSHCAGTLEVEHQKEWRPVSFQHSWSLKAADVVCRQLNCSSAVSTSKVNDWAEPLPAWCFYPNCHGSAHALMDCGTVKK
ncbi:antigen WC1.1-like protein [Lates japonicus]|uniref:Antigen WC1.1-like protein n=1 Tax=Lates japonicus TaxID=270547 RepID=A0AAD3MVT3_LATJO|nr:antigen WC1.1-like protein [Lates japonicus]